MKGPTMLDRAKGAATERFGSGDPGEAFLDGVKWAIEQNVQWFEMDFGTLVGLMKGHMSVLCSDTQPGIELMLDHEDLPADLDEAREKLEEEWDSQ